jgi:hypothetical protein
MRTKWETQQFTIMEMKVTPGEIIVFARLLDNSNLKTELCYPSEVMLAIKTG